MTLTIDISPEVEARIKQEAMKRGKNPEEVVSQVTTLALEALLFPRDQSQAEAALMADWEALSFQSLWEVWDNDEDAVYDRV